MEISNSAAKRSEDYFYLLLHKSHFQKKDDGMGKIEKKGFLYYKNVGLEDSADIVFFLYFFQGTLLVNLLLLNMNVRKKGRVIARGRKCQIQRPQPTISISNTDCETSTDRT